MPNDKAMLSVESSSKGLLSRLSVMMFLQYFVQGAYLPVASVYVEKSLGFSAWEVGVFGSALAVGPVLAPFIVGQLVDRFFATERVVAVCHLVGGGLMLLLWKLTGVMPVIVIGTIYSILYVPTMMLTNSLAFQHLKNGDIEFTWIRAFGTLGFIVPAYLIEFWWLRGLDGVQLDQARSIVFAFSGVAGIVMAFYCLSLPHTPPKGRQELSYAPGIVLAMMRNRDFLVLVIVSFFIAIAHQFFFVWNSPFLRAILDSGNITGAYEQSISSIGQICELAVLAFLGFMLKGLGFKRTLLVGAAAYMMRCVIFSLVFSLDPTFPYKLTLACIGQSLHGFCFGCFLAVGYMYVDRIAPPDVRGSMQTIYGGSIVPLGFFFGGFVGGQVGEWFSVEAGEAVVRDWTSIWLCCAALCAVCVVVFWVWFPNREPAPFPPKKKGVAPSGTGGSTIDD
jgi:nucleoside transporter